MSPCCRETRRIRDNGTAYFVDTRGLAQIGCGGKGLLKAVWTEKCAVEDARYNALLKVVS